MLKCNNVLFYKVTRQNSGIRNANAELLCCLVLTYILWGGSRNIHLPLICYRYTVFGCVALWLQGQVQYIPVWKHRATPLSASPFSPRAGLAFRFLGHKPPSLSRVCVCVWGNAPDRAAARSVCLFCSRFLQTLHRPFYLFMWWVILKPAPPQGHVRPRSASHAVCQGLGKCRHIAAHSRDRAWSLPFITVATVKICGLLFLHLVQKLP